MIMLMKKWEGDVSDDDGGDDDSDENGTNNAYKEHSYYLHIFIAPHMCRFVWNF